jgi:succinate dehydrogenase/fumarate reductase flavoprotein subunit
MRQSTLVLDGVRFPLCSVNTLIIGSGAAALGAAVRLHELGQTDLLIATEAWGGGTSANAGSDKQTYYKLSLAGDEPDSPRQMARDLAAGGCMHGDIALCEAQHSVQAFYHLVQLGVPFPHDPFGGFPGYRTDHDPRGRATSAGPLTSRLMVDALARQVRVRQIPTLDRHQIVALLVESGRDGRRIAGAIAVDKGGPHASGTELVIFDAVNVVLGTGGPGGMYADSVYPGDQTGSIGLAFEAGAVGQNLTESQYGLASVAFRWNVSGSYQQVVPRYVSTDAEGRDEREFLNDVFPDMGTLATAIFRKGYQWPFDARRVDRYGSSLIDLLVYRERVRLGRRVFLDYSRNPDGGSRLGPFSIDLLHPEGQHYLRNCGACGASPIERLRQMNPPAIEMYRGHGIDLERERLEIAVCAQHNNGGLTGNLWWESNIRGLFPIGEVNGSHGVYRPGGAALNAGQVGALRAALYIAHRGRSDPRGAAALSTSCGDQIRRTMDLARRAIAGRREGRPSVAEVRRDIQGRMSRCGAHIRTPALVRRAVGEAWALYHELCERSWAGDPPDVPGVFRNLELCLAHALYLEAIDEYIAQGGQSRGSYLIVDAQGHPASTAVDEGWRFSLNRPGAFVDDHVLEVSLDEHRKVRKVWVKVRPIPRTDTWFESVWKAYREDKVIR